MKYLEKIERVIVLSLLVMMVVVVFLAALDLGYIIAKDIITPPVLLLDIDELLDIFGMFLLVLIGIELLETVKMYLTEKKVHVEVVFTVAMIAIARKVIILDIKEVSSLTLIGIGIIIFALSAGYYLLTLNRLRQRA
ncbi:MAG TPA: phosphate-starvation-inducible PsiE family protein [Dissulfurispiraceae bacterium]|nr:phosphate-starvation-inducible PsiE family protein [Dissulfurispiraceae bacterium]